MRIEENGRNTEGDLILVFLEGDVVTGYALEAAPGALVVFDDTQRLIDYVETRDAAIRLLTHYVEA